MPKKDVRKSAVKTFKQSERARLRNKSVRNRLWTLEKKLRGAAEAGDKAGAAAMLNEQYSELDKAVKYGTLHKNNANRKKARLAALVSGIGKAAAAPAE